jgi:hypothetical protein
MNYASSRGAVFSIYKLRIFLPFSFPHLPVTSVFFYTDILLSAHTNKIENAHLTLHLRLLQMFHLGILPTFVSHIIHFCVIFCLYGKLL